MNDEIIPLEDDIYEEEIEVEEETAVMNAMWGNISGNIENQTDLQQALDAKQDNLTQAQLDAVNSGITSAKVATYDGYPAQITSAVSSEADIRRQADTTLQGNIDAEERARKAADKDIQDVLDGETLARQNADTALGGRIDTEIHDRQVADNGLQSQIDAITSKSDVVDVVANYAALQAYDTSTLGNNDVVKVLDDETHGDAMTYYRWSTTTQTWSYIGQEAPYYTKSQTDTLLLDKQDKIDATHKLSADLVDDTSTTNKFVTAQDKTNWNAKQDALTAGNNIDITGTTISTPAIAPEVVAELPATGTEGKLYLTPKNYTRGTGTGNPITATITDEAGKMESFKLDGDTHQQTYTGKNLLMNKASAQEKTGITITPNSDGSFTLNGTATAVTDLYFAGSWNNRTISYLDMTSGDYTASLLDSNKQHVSSPKFRFEIYDRMGENSTRILWFYGVSSPATFTLESSAQVTAYYISIPNGTSFNNEKFYIQLEKGSTATSFEKYVGGVPSPNPDYPQPIQTVTGEQMVTINSTNYPISLGSIELCKLGTYQDYIWKDGDSWKVHKATAKLTFDASQDETWIKSGQSTSSVFVAALANLRTGGFLTTLDDGTLSKMPNFYFSTVKADGVFRYNRNVGSTYEDYLLLEFDVAKISTIGAFTTWLTNNPSTLYAPIATATDTTITDTDLIAQLEAIRTASLGNGTNTITNSTPEPNLAGDMEVGYYGYNPTNRYDKFIWLDLNNNYEQIGS